MSKLKDLILLKRTEKKWSKREFVNQVIKLDSTISRSAVHQVENGEKENPSVPILISIAKALDISTFDIFTAAGYSDNQQSALQKAFPNLTFSQLDATQKIADILARNDDFSTQEIEKIVRFAEALMNGKK